ncbi:alkaline phosphatase [Fodinibius sediminis]|uniref:Alkaline phosphatase n=1 Tax=Fodinibius sediminis TaxID=1214077 RepID=A0A521BPG1_9BACT|nr:alkaline phosphatase [Fodinibius sediminis]SMO49048.1 alkaline phosphatase [Fodinibius sediminis]
MKSLQYTTLQFILLLVIATGCSSQAHDPQAPPRVKNVILMIGDGMGTAQIYAGLTANRGSLNLEKATHTGFVKTYASDKYVTDSAAGATAYATGHKTYNGAIGVDSTGKPVPSILEVAEQQGLATGLVATSSITHATPASFIAHQPSRDMAEEIAADFLSTDIDVFIGGGREYFSDREDGQDLLEELRARNYKVSTDLREITRTSDGKLAGFLPVRRWSEGRGDQLPETSQTAINLLNQKKKGFFLMIEGSQIDWGSHDNDLQYTIEEMLDFDKTIGDVLEFAEQDGETLVVITADHETGGLTLKDGSLETGEVKGAFSTGGHTGTLVPVFSYGPGAENFSGIYENTTIYDRLMDALNLDASASVASK